MKMPDFFIVGPPKTATTSLYTCLIQHSRIATPPEKEPKFFFHRFYNADTSAYEALYNNASFDQLTFDASPQYFSCRYARHRIREHTSQAKFICVFRDPVERFTSHVRTQRAENKIYNDKLLQPAFFKDNPWREENLWEGERRTVDQIFSEYFEKRIFDKQNYIGAGEYICHLKIWEEFFGKESLLVLIFEELITNSDICLQKIQQFLEIPSENLIFKHENKGANWNKWAQFDFSAECTTAHREKLRAHYSPYNNALAEHLGRTLPWR